MENKERIQNNGNFIAGKKKKQKKKKKDEGGGQEKGNFEWLLPTVRYNCMAKSHFNKHV